MTPRQFYAARAKSIVKELRESKGVPYKELALRLEEQGVLLSDQVLINRINRGSYSFAFALQVLAAMGVTSIDVPKLPEPLAPVAKRRPTKK